MYLKMLYFWSKAEIVDSTIKLRIFEFGTKCQPKQTDSL